MHSAFCILHFGFGGRLLDGMAMGGGGVPVGWGEGEVSEKYPENAKPVEAEWKFPQSIRGNVKTRYSAELLVGGTILTSQKKRKLSEQEKFDLKIQGEVPEEMFDTRYDTVPFFSAESKHPEVSIFCNPCFWGPKDYSPTGNPWDIRTWGSFGYEALNALPLENGVAVCPIYETMREAWEDWRILTALKEAGKTELLDSLLKEFGDSFDRPNMESARPYRCDFLMLRDKALGAFAR